MSNTIPNPAKPGDIWVDEDGGWSWVYGSGPFGYEWQVQGPVLPKKEESIKCECGLDITNVGGNHSTWCPKFSSF